MVVSDRLSNSKIVSSKELPSPESLKSSLSPGEKQTQAIVSFRDQIRNIVHGTDPRLMIVVGPCSIHDVDAAYEYGQRLRELSEEVSDGILLVMRSYFEKPRTISGWKGLINDPQLDDTFQIETGLRVARELLLKLATLELPVACEMLDLISPQFLADLVSWACIGARTTESQTHRELASGLSMPVGFKNGTNGDLRTAVNAIQSASRSHHFLSVDEDGKVSLFGTSGNPDCHIVLRGGSRPNYDSESIWQAEKILEEVGLNRFLMVDCSHGNSRKDFRRQPFVFSDCIHQIKGGNQSIRGLMIESNLHEGNQKMNGSESLKYGVSITDACIGWSATEDLIRSAHQVMLGRM